jgi:hypothetical protein
LVALEPLKDEEGVSPAHIQLAGPAFAEAKEFDLQSHSCLVPMAVSPFRLKPALLSARPVAEEHSCMTFSIGGRRYAFEFETIVTEVNPVDHQTVVRCLG